MLLMLYMICIFQSLRAEIEAHDDVLKSVQEMGTKLARELDDGRDREDLHSRLRHIKTKWIELIEISTGIRYSNGPRFP